MGGKSGHVKSKSKAEAKQERWKSFGVAVRIFVGGGGVDMEHDHIAELA